MLSAVYGECTHSIIEEIIRVNPEIRDPDIIMAGSEILFPAIPGARFAVKGLWLAAILTCALLGLSLAGLLSWPGLAIAVPFVFATAVFFGLSYTGNSAVSNYSSVRREIAQFLPLNVALYVTSLILLVINGGQQ